MIAVAVCIDGALISYSKLPLVLGNNLMFGFVGIGLIIWLASLYDVVRLARPDTVKVREAVKQHFRKGMAHFLSNKLADAEAEFTNVLKLDADDIDARYHLGLTLKAANEVKRARKTFRKCVDLDEEKKWTREIEQELRDLQ